MTKKILIALIFALGLQLTPVFSFAPAVHAQQGQNPPPADNIDSGAFMFDLTNVTHQSIEGTVRQGWIRGGINYFFERIIGFLAAVIGSLAVLMLSVGGFMMLSSGGDETRYEKGKNYAKYSLIGLAVTLMAYVLVTLVQLLITSIYG